MLNGERFDLRRSDRERWRFQNRPDQTAENSERDDDAAPVEAAVFFSVAPGEQNREHDQDRDRADINENLNQADELRAEQKEKRGDADKRDRETERGVHQFWQRRGGERRRERENRDDDESDACSFGETISARREFLSRVEQHRQRDVNDGDHAERPKPSGPAAPGIMPDRRRDEQVNAIGSMNFQAKFII